MVAWEMRLPGDFSTGTDSPVSADSSMAASPSRITPSTGMASPGFTRNISPTTTSEAETVISSPSLRTRASFGESCKRLFSASVVRPLEIDSKSLPTVMRAGIMAADSK